MFQAPSLILLVISIGMFVAQAFAFVDAFSRRPDAYVAADKLTKPAWTIILGLGVLWHATIGWNPIGIVNFIGIVAAIVYIVDVRPALRALTRG